MTAVKFGVIKFIGLPLAFLLSYLMILSVLGPDPVGREDVVTVPACVNVSGTSFFEICEYNVSETSGAPIYLIGDSNANHHKHGAFAAATSLGRPLSISTRGSCPPFAELPEPQALFPPECARNNYLMFDWLKKAKPGHVFLGFSGNKWMKEKNVDFETATLVSLEDSIRVLQGAGHRVSVISPLPSWPDHAKIGPRYCGLVFSLVSSCRSEMSLDGGSSRYYWFFLGKITYLTESMHVSMVDIVPEICPDLVCESRQPNGEWLWNDPHHISALSSQKLAPIFLKALIE
jgi:hypothetical protein